MRRRAAFRIAPAYTVYSASTVMMIAGVMPVALLAKELKTIQNRKGQHSSKVIAFVERERTFDEWQHYWQNQLRGR